jgi:hypothetical protein
MSAAASQSSTNVAFNLQESINYHIRYSLGKERCIGRQRPADGQNAENRATV